MARFDNNRDLIEAENEALHGQLAEAAAEIQEQGRQMLALQAQLADQQRQVNDRDNQIAQLQIQRNVDPIVQPVNVEQILKEMQSPQIIRDMACFTGDPVKLNGFIKAIDRLMPSLERARGTPVFEVWMQAIRAKITQDADAVLELYGTDTDWADIKSTLITHFSDKRDEISLTRDLFKITQEKGIQEFYGNVSHAVSLLVNLLNVNEPNPVVVQAKKNFYQELGLKVFLSGLKEPLGPIIRAQAPKTLKEALRLCLEESNHNYVRNPLVPLKPSYAMPKPLQLSPNPYQFHPQQKLLQFPPSRPFPFQQPQRPFQFPNQPRPLQFPQQQKPFQFHPQPKPHQFPQQQKPLQFFQQPRPFQFPQQQRSFQFGQQVPRQSFPKPTPMEVDQSVRSKYVNYMNRNQPHYQIEEGFQYNPNFDEFYYDQMFQGYDPNHQEESYLSIPQITFEEDTPQAESETQENGASEKIEDDLNFRQPAEGWPPT